MDVREKDGRLSIQCTGQDEMHVYPSSQNEFFYKAVDAQVKFVAGDDGKITKLVLHQYGMDRSAYRQPDTSLGAIDRSASPLWIVAQALRDPGNIGTILRTGDATAAGGLILLDDSADPYSVEAVRASMGAVFTQHIASARWEEFVPWLRSGPGQLVGTSLKTTHDYLEPVYEQPCFLLIGNESQGLPESYEAECDLLVKMPMMGRADSLNAAVAAAVMAFQVRASWRNR